MKRQAGTDRQKDRVRQTKGQSQTDKKQADRYKQTKGQERILFLYA